MSAQGWSWLCPGETAQPSRFAAKGGLGVEILAICCVQTPPAIWSESIHDSEADGNYANLNSLSTVS